MKHAPRKSPLRLTGPPGLPWLLVTALVLHGGFLSGSATGADEGKEARRLGHAGYLIIGAARDSTAGYRWLAGPGPDQISLSWQDGLLTIPDSLGLEPFAEFDLAVPVTAELSGAGASGNLLWQEGAFAVSEPVMITDGVIQFLVSKGELEVLGTRIRYRPEPPVEDKPRADPRASFMMLAGILLLIWILMRRARKQMKARL